MPKPITADDQEAKESLMLAIKTASDRWYKKRGSPEMDVDVAIEPLLNLINAVIESLSCPHCQKELRVRCGNFFTEPLGILIQPVSGDDEDAPPPEHIH